MKIVKSLVSLWSDRESLNLSPIATNFIRENICVYGNPLTASSLLSNFWWHCRDSPVVVMKWAVFTRHSLASLIPHILFG
jgi:hypothetical protein